MGRQGWRPSAAPAAKAYEGLQLSQNQCQALPAEVLFGKMPITACRGAQPRPLPGPLSEPVHSLHHSPSPHVHDYSELLDGHAARFDEVFESVVVVHFFRPRNTLGRTEVPSI